MAVRVIERRGVDLLGEGPLWSDRANALFWVDIYGQKVNRLSLADESVTSWAMPEMVGWVIERRDHPGFMAGLPSGVVTLMLEPFSITPFVDPEPDKPGNRLNDAKADAQGRIWAGSMPFEADKPSGGFYRIDPDGRVTLVDPDYTIANGPALSPDQRFLYHTDTKLGRIYRFPLSDDGRLGERSLFIQFEPSWGGPDGMTVDSEGGLWVAHWGPGRLSRFHDDGRLDYSIAFPASQITSCAFAGGDLSRLFVTSAAQGANEPLAGALFEVETGHRGLAPGRFHG